MKRLSTLLLIPILLLSCNKDEDDQPNNQPPACATNSGNFDISINGSNYAMVVNTETHFSILYNWSGNNATEFVIDAKDQNNNSLYIELGIPGKFVTGSSTHNNTDLDSDFFTIDVDTFNLYVSSVTFAVSQSNLIQEEGVYKPVAATFNGTAHSFPWSNGQPPVNTISFSGSFCLNGVILQ